MPSVLTILILINFNNYNFSCNGKTCICLTKSTTRLQHDNFLTLMWCHVCMYAWFLVCLFNPAIWGCQNPTEGLLVIYGVALIGSKLFVLFACSTVVQIAWTECTLIHKMNISSANLIYGHELMFTFHNNSFDDGYHLVWSVYGCVHVVSSIVDDSRIKYFKRSLWQPLVTG